MSIRVVCEKCRSKLDIKDEFAGTTRRCPKCKSEFVVPQPDDAEDGVELVEEPDEVVEQPKSAPRMPAASIPVSADASRTAAKAKSAAAAAPPPPAKMDDDDDDDEDFMPSFVAAPSKDKTKAERKTPLPPSAPREPSAPGEEDYEDDEPVLSIPKTPPPPKPKFKTFDEPETFPGEEPDDPPPRPRKREMPASLEERPRRNRLSDDFDVMSDPKPKKQTGTPREFNLPAPGSTGLSDPGAATTGGGGTRDRAQAARELRQALKDSALKGPQEVETERSFAFDFTLLASEIGLKGLALLVGACLVAFCVYYLSDLMMGGGPKLPPLGYVSGVVTYNGEPVSGATVFYQPMVEADASADGRKKQKIRTSYGQTDEKGHYKLMYIEGVQGVAVGKCRVWLTLPPPLIVPGEFSQASVTVREVTSGSQTADYPLTGPVKRK